jgi:hypothetical protein
MFPSGEWRGFWEAPGWGRRWVDQLTLRFSNGRVTGEGLDCIGRFTFDGTYTDTGEVHMIKQYLGAHALRYEGRVDGEGAVVGRWSASATWFGPFALMPVIDDVSQLPIVAVAGMSDD